MSPEPSPTPSPRAPARARRIALLTALVACTVAIGAAARFGRGDEQTLATATPQPTQPTPVAVAPGAGPVDLSLRLDRSSVLLGGDGRLRAELLISGQPGQTAEGVAVPTDLVVVLDRSGSMQGPPMVFARAAVLELLDQLSPRDRFALVTYASDGEVTIPLGEATPQARVGWRARVARVTPAGGTHMALGLDLAHQLVAGARLAGRAPRVILISDGHANEGDYSLHGLRQRAARAVAGEYVLSSVGVGAGFDETVMGAIADAGTGNFYYLPDATRLAGVFADEFASARETIAAALEVAIVPADGVQVESASGYPLEREGRTLRFRPGDLAAGQQRHVWLDLRVPTGHEGEIPLGGLSLAFTDLSGERLRLALPALPTLACVRGEDDYFASFDKDVYKRGVRSQGMGVLQEKVAARMRDGEQDEAVSEVRSYMAGLKVEQLRALGYVDAEAFEPAETLHDTVAAPAAASPPVQNRLGKQLLESSRDLSRTGSKR